MPGAPGLAEAPHQANHRFPRSGWIAGHGTDVWSWAAAQVGGLGREPFQSGPWTYARSASMRAAVRLPKLHLCSSSSM
ncbi:hypothetical protein EDD27_9319 [Nonomuraea polychroma]|uniref:Uncharacterized protein n=1 Tax=Nonomuraea polychroma TaxID=46176 RepID=A0A438MLG8_9ACTN|nr:hypothetical protein EDD27_9319 [Nonomuraea polychroma]